MGHLSRISELLKLGIYVKYKKNMFSRKTFNRKHSVGRIPRGVAPVLSNRLCKLSTCTGRNVLFNDALNIFYLRLYGVGHMVKDHSDSERENPLSPHRLLFPNSSNGYFICTIPQTG